MASFFKKKRPIKFRFFCPAANSFIENYNYNGAVDELFDEDPVLIPSQYTGETDNYGNKIWEGDIIQFKRKGFNDYTKAVIEYQEGAFLANVKKKEGGTLSWFWLFHLYEQEDIKVIGNQFENPDLL